MSVYFISGKPGGGKSLYGMKLLVDELVHGSRTIVTNLAVRLPQLNEYFQREFPRAYEKMKMVHISERVVLIEEDDLGSFYCFRGNGVRLTAVTPEAWKAGTRPEFSQITDSGVFYVIDEVHIPFNARAWATTGAGVIYYLTQHRKLGDDLVCITQHVGNVDKQFRSVTQNFTYIKNLNKRKMGLFRLPGIFLRSTYSQPMNEGSATATPEESGAFRLDVRGLASCYDTAKGVGIHGRTGADTHERKTGIHWMWFVFGSVVIVWGWLWLLPKLLVHAVAPVLPVAAHAGAAPTNASSVYVVPPPPRVVYVTNLVTAALPAGGVAEKATNEFWCRGYVMLSKSSGICYFSDGSSVDIESGRLSRIEKSFVVLDGVKVPVRRATVVSAVRPPEVRETAALPPPMPSEDMPPPFGGITVAPTVGGR